MVEFTANCCPECRSKRLYKDGLRHLTDGSSVQRFLCRECGRRFSYGNSNKASGASKKRQVCVTWQGAKNLDPATKIKTVAGESQSNQQDVKGRIISYAFYMEKQGYARETIRGYCSCLKALQVRNANLVDAESVKETLAREKTWSQNRRRNVINAYSLFLKVNGLNWEKPRCHVTRKIPFIPTEREIDLLVAGCSTKTATFLQLLKETGMRSGEAKRLSWTDIDFERRLITLNQPEKRSLPRQWSNLSTKLLNMLNFLPRTNLNVFGESTLNSLKATFCRSRRKLA